MSDVRPYLINDDKAVGLALHRLAKGRMLLRKVGCSNYFSSILQSFQSKFWMKPTTL